MFAICIPSDVYSFSTKFDRKQDFNVLYQVCGFRPIGKTRWPPWPHISWDIFDFCSETAERNSTKLDRKRDLNVLYKVCVFRAGRKIKMAALVSEWLRHFRHFHGIQQNFTGSKISTFSTKFVFVVTIRKTRWPPGLWNRWTGNSTKLDRKQELNVLYHVYVFLADQKNKMTASASHWLWHFWLLLCNRVTEFSETWQKARSQRPLPSLCF